MNQITTLTLSPCIDKSTSVQKFIPEKKLKCAYPQYAAGGGGINVSRALKHFNINSNCVFLSGGYTGKLLNSMVFHEKIDAFPVDSENNTRENFIVFENITHLQFRFGMPVNPVNDSEWKEVIKVLKQLKKTEYLVISGSIDEKVNKQFFSLLYKIVDQNKIKLIVDTAGTAMKEVMSRGAFLIKPNQNEFSGLFGAKQLSPKQIITKAKGIIRNGKIENILVSLGAQGALLINTSGVYHYQPPKLKVKSTVGAGDSMVAGIVYESFNGKDIVSAVKFGVACGSATTVNSGMQLCTYSEATKMLSRIKVKQI